MLGILKIMCDVTEGQKADRKFDSHTMEPFSILNCKTNTDRESRSDDVDSINCNSIIVLFQVHYEQKGRQKANKLMAQMLCNVLFI